MASGTGALLLLVSVFLGAGAAIHDSSACERQPAAAAEAGPSIPATYLGLYQAAGERYGVPWNLLAAIGKVESDHGRGPGSGVRSGANWAGAAGPMQIGVGGKATNTWGGAPRHPASQKTGGYGIDGNADGWADVHDPADAIPTAAAILKAHGAPADIRAALLAYNPSTAYMNKVLQQADRYAAPGTPPVTSAAADPACQQPTARPAPGNPSTSAWQQGPAGKAIAYARAQLGKPYIWGAQGPDAFDCSGLTMMAYRAAGITIPRVTYDQWRHGTRIPKGQEQPGDLVFFRMQTPGPGHVGIVTGEGKMINARCRTCRPGVATQPYTRRRDLVGFTRPLLRFTNSDGTWRVN
jgi:cell wall-associated NlpC family hydrolase